MKFKIVFLGNTKYSTIVENHLLKHFGLTAVITLPDQPQGRKKVLTPTPVKALAQANNVPVISARKLTEDVIQQIQRLELDFLVVADYGLILPVTLLAIPKAAPLNVHHSLLPKYRGPAPAPSVILAGEKTSGVTIIKMVKEIDAGDILAQKIYTLSSKETTDSLLRKLNTLGAEIIVPVIENFQGHKQKALAQDARQATFTKYLKKQDGFIDLQSPLTPEEFDRMVRAYFPWPTVWTRLKIGSSEKIVKFLPEKILQVEGKQQTSLKDFLNGYPKLRPLIEPLFT